MFTNKIFSRTFAGMRKTLAEADKAFEAMDAEMELAFADGLVFTNNNGHVVITGAVRSLRVNDQVIELPPPEDGGAA